MIPGNMRYEFWSYDPKERRDKNGKRWHFVKHETYPESTPFEEQFVEWYFRDDEKKIYGNIAFSHRKDDPFDSADQLKDKIMNDPDFQHTLLKPETRSVWAKNWK